VRFWYDGATINAVSHAFQRFLTIAPPVRQDLGGALIFLAHYSDHYVELTDYVSVLPGNSTIIASGSDGKAVSALDIQHATISLT
jgi:hypothetical protein